MAMAGVQWLTRKWRGWAARADRIILRQIFTVRIFMSNKGFIENYLTFSLEPIHTSVWS